MKRFQTFELRLEEKLAPELLVEKDTYLAGKFEEL